MHYQFKRGWDMVKLKLQMKNCSYDYKNCVNKVMITEIYLKYRGS